MKTTSVEDLKRRALALGGMLELEGKGAFNSARTQMATASKLETPKPPASVAPVVPPPDRTQSAMEALAGATLVATQLQTRVLQTMQAHMQAKPAARAWEFTFTRDAKGDLASIRAISKE